VSIAAIVLAAGRGTRFGDGPKMLASLDDKPLVRHAVEAALAGGLDPVLVVLGHRGEEIRDALSGLAVRIVWNPDYADGLSTSLRAGFAALPRESDAAVILLGDMPRITPALIGQLTARWRDVGRPSAVVPTFAGTRGNPALLSRALAPEIALLEGDAGAGALLRRRRDVVEMALDDPAVTDDVDTADALARLRPGQASTTPCRIAE